MSAKRPTRKELTLPVTVEFEDVDSYHIAHHTKLVAYLERARVRFLSGLGLDLQRTDPHLVLYHLEMRFKDTVSLLDALEVSVFVKSVDSVKLVLGYAIRRDGHLVARAATSLAFVDGKTKTVVPIPEEYARLFG